MYFKAHKIFSDTEARILCLALDTVGIMNSLVIFPLMNYSAVALFWVGF